LSVLNGKLIALAFVAGVAIPCSSMAQGQDGLAETDSRAIDADGLQWRFRVWLDKKEIGFHDFRVNQEGSRTTVDINAQFDVRILFFNAYSYSHRNEESWHGDCLTRLESVTSDNGESLSVLGTRNGQQFVVETHAQRYEDDASCIRSFAYWNPAFLESDRLLNSQTGKMVDVEISQQGSDILEVNGESIAATRYALETKEGVISLWYAQDNGQWLALEAPARGGRVLRYEPVELPFSRAPANPGPAGS